MSIHASSHTCLGFEDFIPVYPDVDVPEIQSLITAKKEFVEMEAQIREPAPKRGEYYKHQKLFMRLLLQYDAIINIQETGTGKSCALIAAAEYMKKHPGNIRKVYVMEKGPSTKNDFKNQIICKCTDGEYETDIVKNAQYDKTRKGNITREIKKWYEVITYSAFANMVTKNNMTDEEIIKKFSGSLFFVDEAHNLRNDKDVASDTDVGSDTDPTGVYGVIWRVFHLVKRSKFVVASATPGINGVSEIPRMLNLVLPRHRQLPLDWDYTKVTLGQMEEYFRGKIVFVRGLDTGAVPVFKGQTMDVEYKIDVPAADWIAPQWVAPEPQPMPPTHVKNIRSQVVVYPTMMSDHQSAAYEKARNDHTGVDTKGQNQKGQTNFRMGERQAATFVFPDSSYGGSIHVRKDGSEIPTFGLGKYVQSTGDDQYVSTPEFKKLLANPEQLAMMSSKFSDIMKVEEVSTGCSFIFSEFLSGGGAILMGQCLEANGYSKYNEMSSVFVTTDVGETSICSGTSGTRTIRPDFHKKKRFALFTSKTSESKMASILELYNSEENCYGEYIKVFIGSPVARDGINVFNVIEIHLLTAAWHPAGSHQALSRGLRSTSHAYLISLLCKQAVINGIDPDTVKIEVNIYQHVAISRGGDSVDMYLYQMSEEKDLHIRRMIHMMKQCAIDCQIHYDRNVRAGDIDGSKICDYEDCHYQCVTAQAKPTPDQLDFSTYDILYAEDIVNQVVRDLTDTLRDSGSITFVKLLAKWVDTGMYREKFIYMAIDKMLSDKKQLIDRFGFGCYLYTDGFNIYTQREFPVGNSGYPELSIYGEQVIGVSCDPFERLVSMRQEGSQNVIIAQMEEIDDPSTGVGLAMFVGLLNKLAIDAKVRLFEKSIIELANGKENKFSLAMYNKFRSYIYQTPEPWRDIERSSEALRNKGQGQGRKPSANSKVNLKIDFEGAPALDSLMPDGSRVENVYAHTLHNTEHALTKYAITSVFDKAGGRIRIFKPSESTGWRDTNQYEFPAYKFIIKTQLIELKKPFEQMGVYGTIHHDGRFRIRDRESERESSKNDGRHVNRGRNAITLSKPALIYYLLRGMYRSPEFDAVVVPPMTRQDMIAMLLKEKYHQDPEVLNKMTDEQLNYVVRWYISKFKRSYMCSVIMQGFFTNKLIFFV